jgi:hypothetical protein
LTDPGPQEENQFLPKDTVGKVIDLGPQFGI